MRGLQTLCIYGDVFCTLFAPCGRCAEATGALVELSRAASKAEAARTEHKPGHCASCGESIRFPRGFVSCRSCGEPVCESCSGDRTDGLCVECARAEVAP